MPRKQKLGRVKGWLGVWVGARSQESHKDGSKGVVKGGQKEVTWEGPEGCLRGGGAGSD